MSDTAPSISKLVKEFYDRHEYLGGKFRASHDKELIEEVSEFVRKLIDTNVAKIAKTFNHDLATLMRYVTYIAEDDKCRGVSANGKRCNNSNRNGENGYCNLHKGQYKPRIIHIEPSPEELAQRRRPPVDISNLPAAVLDML
jgi:hypothetical protein